MSVKNEVSIAEFSQTLAESVTGPNQLGENPNDNDAWFISFAQLTVDRMLKRYGILSSSDTPVSNHISPTLKLAA